MDVEFYFGFDLKRMLTFRKYFIVFISFSQFLSNVWCIQILKRIDKSCMSTMECIIITTCDEAKAKISSGSGNYPKICGWAGKEPMVCCLRETTTELLLDSEENAPRMFIGNRQRVCGIRSTRGYSRNNRYSRRQRRVFRDRIPRSAVPIDEAVGGTRSLEKWPWMVAIYSGKERSFTCGGTLIDERHVLTSAHCFISLDPRSYSVHVGDLNLDEIKRYYEIEDIKIHEGYSEPFFYDDVAIVRLKSPLLPVVTPACLPYVEDAQEGDRLTTLGWGDLSFDGESSQHLQEVHGLPVVGNKECNEKYTRIAKVLFPKGIWEKFICAGLDVGGKDSCQGDSGGPLLRRDSRGLWTVVGIVSFGYKCGLPGFPGVYTKVSPYLQWIANYIEDKDEEESDISIEGRKTFHNTKDELMSNPTNERIP